MPPTPTAFDAGLTASADPAQARAEAGPSQGGPAGWARGPGQDAPLEPAELIIGRSERSQAALAGPPARPAIESAAGQIGIQIVRAASNQLRQVLVQLEPAELGRVEIRLDFAAHGQLKAAIAVERSDTLELLQRDAQALERSLQESGLRLDSGGVGFSLRRERGQGGEDGAAGGTGTGVAARAESPSADGAAAPGAAGLALRLLDIHA